MPDRRPDGGIWIPDNAVLEMMLFLILGFQPVLLLMQFLDLHAHMWALVNQQSLCKSVVNLKQSCCFLTYTYMRGGHVSNPTNRKSKVHLRQPCCL